jgi:hypothetical protein
MRLTVGRVISGIALAASLSIAPQRSLAQDRPADCHGDKSVCQIIVEGEQELASMLVSGDVSTVTRLFADDAIWTLASGERWTKPEAVAALRNAPRMTSSRLLRASVYQHGSVAVVTWNESWRDPAKKREQQSFGTDTWMLRDAGWQIIASQEARVPPSPAG